MEENSYTDIKERLPIMATAGEVAQVLRCSRQTVYKLFHENKLGACRLGRSLRFTNMEVDLFVSRNTTETDADNEE